MPDAVRDPEGELSGIGYEDVEANTLRRLFYRRPGYHLHIVAAGTWGTRNQRILRDHLRTNDQDPAT
ncbi:hypothetical protein Aab01nite_01500 [Paractinoplanes abujensis]|uniref:GrpB-like predicted nucleotidyltransferase (UPF0157 family) n=1 Tax=Paractinoplanes abujensis TaxID=882441 RepID=A0A7W7CNX1_9ACTN|nr:GrpB family protein [Actinoplanes abujensis]MBB4692024.1 GrpB-like predicted nucleotidyltransferase (UPF0157 family) [Actinoplanes abujensis]GID16560.1 hypothetical protein Aab01nite_01500 [Actinoplanes abujensis]